MARDQRASDQRVSDQRVSDQRVEGLTHFHGGRGAFSPLFRQADSGVRWFVPPIVVPLALIVLVALRVMAPSWFTLPAG